MDTTTDAGTDQAIVRAMARGDADALARTFDRYAPTLTRYAWALADDAETAEEIVQEAFLTLWRRAATLHLPGRTLLPWLLVVCRHQAVGAGERAGSPDDVPPEHHAPPGGRAAASEQLRWVRAAIDALPEVDRRLCGLALLDGHSYAEAAGLLGLHIGKPGRAPRDRRRNEKVVTPGGH